MGYARTAALGVTAYALVLVFAVATGVFLVILVLPAAAIVLMVAAWLRVNGTYRSWHELVYGNPDRPTPTPAQAARDELWAKRLAALTIGATVVWALVLVAYIARS